ncbi:TolC family protein [Limnobacter humi]|uniref:TolC family protein n=1 Tax=Limnobacter humi TaxID=1778671 RepID=A0ABT1WGX1_9BURK|nr:TolC family protein [Limnobacter humi]MCQ8896758.1 TolC family protein [Limnobacter humi]
MAQFSRWQGALRWAPLIVLCAMQPLYAADVQYTLNQAQQALDNQAPIGLDEAIGRAVERSQSLMAVDKKAQMARLMARESLAGDDPVLNLSLTNLPINGADAFSVGRDFMTMRSVGFMQTWVRQARRQAQSAVFASDEMLARVERAQQLSHIKTETAKAWLSDWLTNQMLRSVAQQKQALDVQLLGAQAGFESHTQSATDVLNAKAALLEWQQLSATLQAQQAIARHDLKRWAGTDVGTADFNAERLSQTPWRMEGLVTQIERLPELNMAQTGIAKAQAQLALRKESLEPDWTYSVMLSARGSQFSDMLTVGASRPLLWNTDEKQAVAIEAAQAGVLQMQAEYIELQRMLQHTVERQLVQYQSLLTRWTIAQQSILPLAQTLSQQAQADYASGKITLTTLATARRQALNAELDSLRQQLELALTWADLQYLTTPE